MRKDILIIDDAYVIFRLASKTVTSIKTLFVMNYLVKNDSKTELNIQSSAVLRVNLFHWFQVP